MRKAFEMSGRGGVDEVYVYDTCTRAISAKIAVVVPWLQGCLRAYVDDACICTRAMSAKIEMAVPWLQGCFRRGARVDEDDLLHTVMMLAGLSAQ